MEIKELIDGAELLVEYDKELPVLIKDKLLLSPGIWNGVKYTVQEIADGFKNTDWHNKSNCQLYLDHQDTKEAGVGNYVGFILNTRLSDTGDLRGDLQIWNPLLAVYLTKAKAKFGVSATLKGTEDKENGKMKDFHFESFSIVTKPACKTAYINLSQNEGGKIITPPIYETNIQLNQLKGGKMDEVKKLQEEEIKTEVTQEMQETEVETELAKKKEEEPKEEEQTKKKEYPYPKEEKCVKKKEDKYPKEEEMSDEEFGNITMNSDWTDFIKKMKDKYPKMGFKEIAKAYKEKSQSQTELEARTDEELMESLHQIIAVLRRRKAYPEEPKKEESELAGIKKELQELKQKINEPDSKTVNLSSVGPQVDPTTGMAAFLTEIAGKGISANFTI